MNGLNSSLNRVQLHSCKSSFVPRNAQVQKHLCVKASLRKRVLAKHLFVKSICGLSVVKEMPLYRCIAAQKLFFGRVIVCVCVRRLLWVKNALCQENVCVKAFLCKGTCA